MALHSKIQLIKDRGWRAARSRASSLVQSQKKEGHVLLLHNGRSGSTLLGDMLDQHPAVFWDGETIEKKMHKIGDKKGVGLDHLYGCMTEDDAIAHTHSRMKRCAGNKIFGTELQDYHVPMVGGQFDSYMRKLKALGFTKFAYLDRNYMRKVVSHIMATEKNLFHIKAKQKSKIQTLTIDPERVYIGHRFTSLLEALQQYQDFHTQALEVLGSDALLDLSYEEHIKDDPNCAAIKVCHFLGIEPHNSAINFGKTTNVAISDLVENYDDVKQALAGTQFEQYLAES